MGFKPMTSAIRVQWRALQWFESRSGLNYFQALAGKSPAGYLVWKKVGKSKLAESYQARYLLGL